MRNADLISVLMGTRAGGAQLDEVRRAVRSILDQEEVSLELLVCVTGADDEVRGWLAEQGRRDGRLRLVDSPGAALLGQKLNACLDRAEGGWIARMDDDDYSYPDRLRTQLAFLKAHGDCALVGCWVRETGLSGTQVRRLPEYPTAADFRMTQPFIHPALFFRREALDSAGGYSASRWQDHCEDYDLLLRMYRDGRRGANVQRVLLDYSIVRSQERRRPYRYYVNEAVTRHARFSQLGRLPAWAPYVVKPLVVGAMPRGLVRQLKLLKRKREP